MVVEGSGATAWSPITLVRDADDTDVDDDVVELGTVETPKPSRVDVELAPLPEVIETVDEASEPDDSGVDEVENFDDDVDDAESAPTPVRVMPHEDLIAAIRYSQKKSMFSVAQTVEELDVTAEAVHEALAEIKSRDPDGVDVQVLLEPRLED